eukprot:scaffold22291_cov66-Phaeocystis_antarctica.AAC.2
MIERSRPGIPYDRRVLRASRCDYSGCVGSGSLVAAASTSDLRGRDGGLRLHEARSCLCGSSARVGGRGDPVRRPDRAEVGHARVGRLVRGGQALVRRRVLAELGAAATKFTLRFVEVASRPGGSATSSRSPAIGGSAASAQGLLGGSGGSDAAGAAAAGLAAHLARWRWRAFPVATAAPGWCCSLDWQSEEWGVAGGSAGLASQRGACTGPS